MCEFTLSMENELNVKAATHWHSFRLVSKSLKVIGHDQYSYVTVAHYHWKVVVTCYFYHTGDLYSTRKHCHLVVNIWVSEHLENTYLPSASPDTKWKRKGKQTLLIKRRILFWPWNRSSMKKNERKKEIAFQASGRAATASRPCVWV